MRIHYIYAVLLPFLLTGVSLCGQVRISSASELELLRDTPMETMYLHGNGNLFFPGEYLYYSLYCINTGTYRLSELSKLAYVHLIGENGDVAFTRKIPLDRGKGQGDFFFPTDLPSGNYKLVAYTHWMKNAGDAQYFMSDLTFINPYRSDQQVFLGSQTDSLTCAGNADSGEHPDLENASNDVLGLKLDRVRYHPGENVLLTIQNFKGNLGAGTYSLSVRRADELPHAPVVTAAHYALRYPELVRKIPQRVNDVLFIPEQRGALISGQVTARDGNEPLPDRMLAISLPGEDFQIKKALTDSEGKFYTYLTRPFPGTYGFAEVLPSGETAASFTWAETHRWEGAVPCFHKFELDDSMAPQIRMRSIHNQIENSYFEVKPDTLLKVETTDPFQGDVPQVFDLDEFTRFPTLRETFIEIVNFVMVRRVDSGDETFRVLPAEGEGWVADQLDPPLVLVDGILVPNEGSLLDYDARRIKEIKVLRGQYQIGGEVYGGMVAIETIDGIYAEEWSSVSGTRFSYLPQVPQKRYFRQDATSGQIPDYRSQLLWEPDIRMESAGQSFSFLISNITGTYEIRLEGYTAYGKPISLFTTFSVAADP